MNFFIDRNLGFARWSPRWSSEIRNWIASEDHWTLLAIFKLKISAHNYYVYGFALPRCDNCIPIRVENQNVLQLAENKPYEAKNFLKKTTNPKKIHDGNWSCRAHVDCCDRWELKTIRLKSCYKVWANVRKGYSVANDYNNLDIYQINSTYL